MFWAKLWLWPGWGKRRSHSFLQAPVFWWWNSPSHKVGDGGEGEQQTAEDSFCYRERATLFFPLRFLGSGFSLSCQTFSEPEAMLIVHEVLPGTPHDSCSVLYVVLGPKRRDEMAVSIPLGDSSPQKDHGCGVHPSTLHPSAGRLPGGSPSTGCLRALANTWASLDRIWQAAPPALCRNTCPVLACSYHEPELLGSLRSHALQAGQTQLA